ncbi:MAG: hypothetical protein COA45_08150 [Zetaproteobacteria bacterium]|nr:MAG: hypothetical protein COA45_08150 [Zetaproteobacteria bacterium]
MSSDILKCSVKHQRFNKYQERLQTAQMDIPELVRSFSSVVKGQDDHSKEVHFAALSRNNQYILHDITRSDRVLESIDEHYQNIPNAGLAIADVWEQSADIKVKFDEMRSQYESNRDEILQRAENMKVSYDQLELLIKEGNGVSEEDFAAISSDLQASTLDA